MPIVTLCAQKGGAGKTTLAASLAAAAVAEGARVALVDLDPQGSASQWHAARQASDVELLIANAVSLARQVQRLRERGGWVIVDTPPHSSTVAATAVAAADLALVPTRAAAVDLGALPASATLVREHARRRAAVLNALPPGGADQEVVEFVEGELALPILGRLGHRVAFERAVESGRGVTEHAPRSKADIEFQALWSAIKEAVRG